MHFIWMMRSQSKPRADAEAGKYRRYLPAAGCAQSGTRSEPCESLAVLESYSHIILPVRVKVDDAYQKWRDNYSTLGRTEFFELLALPLIGGEMFEKAEDGTFGDCINVQVTHKEGAGSCDMRKGIRNALICSPKPKVPNILIPVIRRDPFISNELEYVVSSVIDQRIELKFL
jgi:hypothetical protein